MDFRRELRSGGGGCGGLTYDAVSNSGKGCNGRGVGTMTMP